MPNPNRHEAARLPNLWRKGAGRRRYSSASGLIIVKCKRHVHNVLSGTRKASSTRAKRIDELRSSVR